MSERELELAGEVQSLRLELAEQQRTVAQLKQELARRQEGASRQSEAQLERLLTDLAAPVSQLLTQSYLVRVEDKPVAAGAILSVAERLVRGLEDYGLTTEGEIGQTAPFDPNRHEPLSAEVAVAVGQNVVIRLVGLSYQGKLLRKAGVVTAGES